MHIRPETPADFATLNTLHIRAFGNHFNEAALVALLRTRVGYDPELSLVAEINGQVVGHAMFNPLKMLIHGQEIHAVNLAPLAVHPDYQKQGIGDALMRRGHQIAQEQDYELSILLGHPTYYPRFGYVTHTFGTSSIEINTQDLETISLETSPPLPDDVPILAELYRINEQNVDLTLIPEATLAEWLSPNTAMPCTVYRHEGKIVGYTRGTAEDVRLFLARDDKSARAIAKHLAENRETMTLPLHPKSSTANAFSEIAQATAWDAGMICPLRDGSVVHDYLSEIAASKLVGRVIWFSVFDIA